MTERPEDHNPDVHKTTRARGPFSPVYAAWCTCGWRGEDRPTDYAASEDVSAHLHAVLPNDAEGSIYR